MSTSGRSRVMESLKQGRFAVPYPLQGLGAYSYGGLTGVLPAALAGDSEILQFRWADTTRFAIINKIVLAATVSTTFFAAGVPVAIGLRKSTAWTAAGTGGTGVAPAALLKHRTSMGSTLVATGDLRIATTGALGAGTKVLEGEPLAVLCGPGPTAAPGVIFPPNTVLFEADTEKGVYPILLATNEGISVTSIAVPGTGTWKAAININWMEVEGY